MVVPISGHAEQDERLGGQQVGHKRRGQHAAPMRVAEEGGDRIGEEDEGQDQEQPLGVSVGAEQDQGPDGDGGDGNGDVPADPEQLQGGADAGELGDDQADVGQHQADEGEGGPAQGELLADQGGQAFAGVRAEPGAHLLDHDQGDGDQEHEEQRPVDELGAGEA